MSQEAKPTRRDILKQGLVVGVGLSVLPLATGCQTRKDKPAAVTTGIVNIGPARDYPAGTVSTKYLAQYGIAITNDSGTVMAIWPRCTHQACMTQWEPERNQFICPCHGSRFDNLGQVLQGPAKQPLRGIATIPNADGTLSVDLDKLYAKV